MPQQTWAPQYLLKLMYHKMAPPLQQLMLPLLFWKTWLLTQLWMRLPMLPLTLHWMLLQRLIQLNSNKNSLTQMKTTLKRIKLRRNQLLFNRKSLQILVLLIKLKRILSRLAKPSKNTRSMPQSSVNLYRLKRVSPRKSFPKFSRDPKPISLIWKTSLTRVTRSWHSNSKRLVSLPNQFKELWQ